MDQCVVCMAEQDQIREFGLTPMGPVLDVMAIEKYVVVATRETTMAIPHLQGPAHGSRYRAPPSTHVQGFAIVPGSHGNEATITRHPPQRFRGNVRAVRELRPPGVAAFQDIRSQVHE